MPAIDVDPATARPWLVSSSRSGSGRSAPTHRAVARHSNSSRVRGVRMADSSKAAGFADAFARARRMGSRKRHEPTQGASVLNDSAPRSEVLVTAPESEKVAVKPIGNGFTLNFCEPAGACLSYQ